MLHPRIGEEWADIQTAYPDATYFSEPERIKVTLTLTPNQYNVASTALLVTIPPGYPFTGPDGFLVPSGFQLMNGTIPASDATGIGFPGWLLVSFHMMDASGQSTWRATSDPKRGDNMVGYLASVESFLSRECN